MQSFPELPVLTAAGLDAETMRQVDRLLIGCGGFARELIIYTGGASEIKGSGGDRLSAADCLVDHLLRFQLQHLVPGSSGFGEEGGHWGAAPEGARVWWLVDPVDGTRPATLGSAFAVSVGALVLEGGRPAAAVGWVYLPTLGALYRGVLHPGGGAAVVNDLPARVEGAAPGQFKNRHLAVNSDWHRIAASPAMKITALGATAVHLVQLVHPGSDVVAAAETRYYPHDAAGGLPVAVGGGCRVYAIDRAGRPAAEALDPLEFLHRLYLRPGDMGPHVLVAPPGVADFLREA